MGTKRSRKTRPDGVCVNLAVGSEDGAVSATQRGSKDDIRIQQNDGELHIIKDEQSTCDHAFENGHIAGVGTDAFPIIEARTVHVSPNRLAIFDHIYT